MDKKKKQFRKFYMLVFNNRKELYDEFLKLYNEAVEAGSTMPEDIAMIKFRDRWMEGEDGEWLAR